MKIAYQELHKRKYSHSLKRIKMENSWVDCMASLQGLYLQGKYVCRRIECVKSGFCMGGSSNDSMGHKLIDCQVHTEHLERFGAREIRG